MRNENNKSRPKVLRVKYRKIPTAKILQRNFLNKNIAQ